MDRHPTVGVSSAASGTLFLVLSLQPPSSKSGPPYGFIFLLQIPLLVTGDMAEGEIQRKQNDPSMLISGPEGNQGYKMKSS